MKFIIFGIGKYYLDHRDEMVTSMEPEDEIVGFIDNRVTKIEQLTEELWKQRISDI